MYKSAVAAILAGAVLFPAAAADSELYVNGGLAIFDAEGANINALNLRGGVEFNELFGAEFEAAFGLGAEDVGEFDDAQLEVENQLSGVFVGRYPVLPNADVLGRIGYTTGELQTSVSGVSSDAEIDGFAFGFGGEYMFTEALGIRTDYTRIEVDNDEVDGGLNVFSIGGVFKFGEVR